MPSDDIKFVLRVPVRQYSEACEVAKIEGKSLNRWFLERIFGEAEDGNGRDGVRVRRDSERREGQGGTSEAVRGASVETRPSNQPSAVARGSKSDREKQGKRCEAHGRPMKDFGNAWVCEGPPTHKELK
jgi:hypothetical protein